MANSPGALLDRREIRHFHLFCGLGGGARGASRRRPRCNPLAVERRHRRRRKPSQQRRLFSRRPSTWPAARQGYDYATAGHFGVIPWDGSTGAVSSAACQDNGRWSVADPRLHDPTDRVVAVIRALDGTWHRPFTTFELAGLQSLVGPEEQLELDGLSDADWRERIGNAVPPDAAQAIASTMGTTLLLDWSGEGFMLSSVPIWVRPVAVALSVKPQDWEEGL